MYLNTTGGETIVNGPLTVTNNKPTILTGTLNVNGATDLDNTLNVDGVATISNATESTGKTNGALVVVGGAGIGKNINVGGNGDVDGTLNVDGVTTISNATESTSKTNGALIVKGGVGISKNLNVGGNTDLDGALNADGATTLNNTLTVVGNTTINGLTNITNTTQSTLPTNGAFTVAGGVGVGKNLNVGGNQDVDGSLNTDGATTLKSTLAVDGAADLNSSLNVDGATTLKSTVAVDGAIDLNSSLNVDGVTTHNAQVTINANVNGAEDNDGAYPLRVKGSNQGIVIEVDGSRANANNFLTFRDANGIQGTIEGETYDELTTTGEFIATNALFAADGVTIAAEGVACGFQLDLGEVAVMVAQALVIVAQAATYNAMVLSDVGVAFTSGSGDYAEWLEKSLLDETFTYGDIVGVRGGKITKNTEVADHFMVVSLSPIVLGNMPKKGEEKNYRKVAFMGQVPVKVTGKVAIGDYIIPRGDNKGFGIAVSPAKMTLEQYRQIVGVAWTASKANTSFSMINVAVGINSNDLVAKLIKQQAELDEVKGKMNGIVAYLKAKDANFKEELFDVPTSTTIEPAKAVAINPLPAPVATSVTPSLAGLKENFAFTDFNDLFEKKPDLFESSLATTKQNFINQGADLSKNPELNRLLNDREYLKATIKKIYGTKK